MQKRLVRIKPAYLITALTIVSAALVFAGPQHRSNSRHQNTRGNHGVAANGHGNSDFGHRQGDPTTRTTGSGNNYYGKHHKDGDVEPSPTASPSPAETDDD